MRLEDGQEFENGPRDLNARRDVYVALVGNKLDLDKSRIVAY